MIAKLLTEHHFEFPSLKGGCRGSPESTHVKMPNCWKSHALAHDIFVSPTKHDRHIGIMPPSASSSSSASSSPELSHVWLSIDNI